MLRLMAQLRTLKILWLALFASLAGYVMVVVFARGMPQPPLQAAALGANSSALIGALALAAVGAAGASFILPRVMLKAVMKKLDAQFEPLSARELGLYRGPFVIGVALSQSVALFGLVLGVLHYGAVDYVPFFVAGALLMLAHYPLASRVRVALDRARGGGYEMSSR